nr:MAG TPA: hypothetical protein [Caudoviricetes sp.]
MNIHGSAPKKSPAGVLYNSCGGFFFTLFPVQAV